MNSSTRPLVSSKLPEGYRIKITTTLQDRDGTLSKKTKWVARAYKGTRLIGFVNAVNYKFGTAWIGISSLEERHRGKGLGFALYEALLKHIAGLGIKWVEGDVHSSDAARVHQKLAKKYGLKYPHVNQDTYFGRPFDSAFPEYRYSLAPLQ